MFWQPQSRHRELPQRARTSLAIVLAAGLVTGCNERGRITFPTSIDGLGPSITFTQPILPDTTVPAGPNAFVSGRVEDPDGIDSVYFDVSGGLTTFPPLKAQGDPVVSFSLPLTTTGLSGATMVVQVYATDRIGIRGDTVSRRVIVQ